MKRMGVSIMEYGIYAGKGVVFTIKGCCISVYNHPLLVCMVCALIYTARSFPFMFSLLVSASPVIVCTALLLGTLLFYGQQNIHETEIEMKTKYEAVSLKNRLSIDSSVVDQNDRPHVEKCDESKRDDVEPSLVMKRLDEIRVGAGSADGLSLGRSSFGVESKNSEENGALSAPLQEARGECDEEREREGLGDGEVMADHYAIVSKVIGELLDSESDHEKSEADSCDSERGHREEHDEAEDDEDLDSGSGGGEVSSHDDTSVDEIMPMLDELHPLLDEETAQPPPTSCAASEAALTEHSPRSSISSIDETDLQELEAADDDDEEDEEQDEKEDHSKSIITWTEEDQKNLMEVGNSEIERNQRLERILRRRKNRSMVPEITLMDFEKSDFHVQVPPISTARNNPFDLPNESIPGSAPSVLLQRTNPFDIPYDDDDPNGMAEESLEEHKPSLTRHPFMRRRDYFTPQPSIFSPNRLQRRPMRLKPFFVAEQQTAVADESSYSPLKRQSSGQSSGADTESVASVEILEDDDLEEGDDAYQDADSDDQETSNMSTLAAEVPSKGPVYDTDMSPSAEKRAQWEAVNEGESVGAAYHQIQMPDSTSMEENARSS